MRQERKYNFAKLYLLSHTQLALFTELLKRNSLCWSPRWLRLKEHYICALSIQPSTANLLKSTEIINDASNFDRYNWDMK